MSLFEYLLDDMTSKQIVFPKGSPCPSKKNVIFRQSSTFFLDLLKIDPDKSGDEETVEDSFMIGPFQSRDSPMEVNVEAQLLTLSYPSTFVYINPVATMGDTKIPVVRCPCYGFLTTTNFLNIERPVNDLKTLKKRDKVLIDISKQLQSSLRMETKKRIEIENTFEELQTTLQDKLELARDSLSIETSRRIEVEKSIEELRSENEKMSEQLMIEREDKNVVSKKLEDQILSANELVAAQQAMYETQQEANKKHHEELESTLRNEVHKAEKELANISRKFECSLNAEIQKRIEVEKILEEERDEHTKVRELANEHKFALENLQVERKKLLKERDDALKEVDVLRKTSFTFFSLSEIAKATDNLNISLKIGEGGFGIVYKGSILNETFAIKILNKESLQGEAEFNQEVEILSKIRHPNLVTLIGASLKVRALVYEFVPNGSLDTFINNENNSKNLSWKDRIRIASEICSALIFLHSIPPHGIAHGDLKPENILLDSNYVSKIADFGISRTLQQTNKTITPFHLTLFPKFTPAYCDPEFFSSSELTPQCDIYSFGIILLQLVTGRDPIRIKDFVEDALETGIVDNLVDSSAGEWPIEEAKKLALVGLQCSHPSRRKRPDLATDVWPSIESMKHVAGLIERETRR